MTLKLSRWPLAMIGASALWTGAGCGDAGTTVEAGAGSTSGVSDESGDAGATSEPQDTDPTSGGEAPASADNCFFIGPKEVCVQPDDPTPEFGGMDAYTPPMDNLAPLGSLPLQGFTIPDQGSCGSCVAFATRSAMGVREIVERDHFTDYSAAHVWHLAGYGAEDCPDGSNIGVVVNAQVYGDEFVVPTSIWPYDPVNPTKSLNMVPGANTLAAHGFAHVAKSAAVKPHSVDDIRGAIAQGYPVILSVPVYTPSGFSDNSGDVGVPAPNAVLAGHHAIAVVSYDDFDGEFGFANSWGTSWGSSGFGTLDYAFVSAYASGGVALVDMSYAACPDCNVCGDGACDPGETQGSCCADCGCAAGKTCDDVCVCPPGLADCAGGCVDLDEDADHCGGCGLACDPGEVCLEGGCALDCGGLEQCGDSCVDLETSEVDCGACGHKCGAGDQCLAGQCACAPQPETCDGVDNDCDDQVDEGVKNACGGCGPAPVEVCDGFDNDCDDQVDEGVADCGIAANQQSFTVHANASVAFEVAKPAGFAKTVVIPFFDTYETGSDDDYEFNASCADLGGAYKCTISTNYGNDDAWVGGRLVALGVGQNGAISGLASPWKVASGACGVTSGPHTIAKGTLVSLAANQSYITQTDDGLEFKFSEQGKTGSGVTWAGCVGNAGNSTYARALVGALGVPSNVPVSNMKAINQTVGDEGATIVWSGKSGNIVPLLAVTEYETGGDKDVAWSMNCHQAGADYVCAVNLAHGNAQSYVRVQGTLLKLQ